MSDVFDDSSANSVEIEAGTISELKSMYDCIVVKKDGATEVIVKLPQVKVKFQFISKSEPLTASVLDSALDESIFEEEIKAMNAYLLKATSECTSLLKRITAALEVFKNITPSTLKQEDYETDSMKEQEVEAVSVKMKKFSATNTSKGRNKDISIAASFSKQSAGKGSKKPPMKTASDVIKRIKWDRQLDSTQFIVGYEDRFVGIVEKDFGDFDWDSDIASVGPDILAIPQHRIQYFKYQDEIVWDKRNRHDEVFGSTGSKTTILEIILKKSASLMNHGPEESGYAGEASSSIKHDPCPVLMPSAIEKDLPEKDNRFNSQAQNVWEEENKLNDCATENKRVDAASTLDSFQSTPFSEGVVQPKLEMFSEKNSKEIQFAENAMKSSDINVTMSKESSETKDMQNPLLEGRKCKGFVRTQKPNYFICIRINSAKVKEQITRYSNKLETLYKDVEAKAEFRESLTSLSQMHITICVCHLDTDEDIEKVKQVLESTFINAPVVDIIFKGLDNFDGGRVLWVKPHCNRAVYCMQKRIMDELEKKGVILDGNFKPYQPHLTIMKLGPRRRYLYKTIAGFVKGKKSRNWEFGEQESVTTLHLCEMKLENKGDDDTFFRIAASVPIQFLPDDSVGAADDHMQMLIDEETYQTRKSMYDFHGEDFDRCPREPRGRRYKKKHHRFKNYKHSTQTFEEKTPQQKADIKISKALSAVLRHNKFGLKVDSEGYITLDTLLRHQLFHKSLSATREAIYRVVETNDKKRFTINIGEDGVERIKANQGHSVEVENLELTEITDACDYPNVIHGTFWNAWRHIKGEGLHKRKRIHIHMTTAEPADENKVISGMKRSCTIFIYIDLEAALKDGLEFFLSTNGVVLSPGDEKGYLKPKYFKEVVGISHGNRCSLLEDISSVGNVVDEHFHIDTDVAVTSSSTQRSEISGTSLNDMSTSHSKKCQQEDLVIKEENIFQEKDVSKFSTSSEKKPRKCFHNEEGDVCSMEYVENCVKDNSRAEKVENKTHSKDEYTPDKEVEHNAEDFIQSTSSSVTQDVMLVEEHKVVAQNPPHPQGVSDEDQPRDGD
ncbi:unnamed protein product [Clavelina lepadiformis]|uniref:2'-phosphotransferase n=1 Tax=Clavelina lepadiformis TaxID=159417 RepID=A0ABP0H699_CLALP